jgi:hypothetical protein
MTSLVMRKDLLSGGQGRPARRGQLNLRIDPTAVQVIHRAAGCLGMTSAELVRRSVAAALDCQIDQFQGELRTEVERVVDHLVDERPATRELTRHQQEASC